MLYKVICLVISNQGWANWGEYNGKDSTYIHAYYNHTHFRLRGSKVKKGKSHG